MSEEIELPRGFDDLRGEVVHEFFEVSEVFEVSSRTVVFTGRDPQTNGEVLLRFHRPQRLHDEATLARLEQRAKAASRVRHPSVVPPLAWGERFDGKLYVVYQRPPGEPLDAFLSARAEGGLAWADARAPLLDLAGAAAAAHGRHVRLGSLDPRATWIETMSTGSLSMHLLYLGTNTYPEPDAEDAVFSGTTNVGGDGIHEAPETAGYLYGDERADVYLFGLIAYTMLTGKPPFRGRNKFQVISRHMSEPVPSMREHGADVPSAVDEIVRRALAKEPRERPSSMIEIDEALRAIDEHGQRCSPDSSVPPRARRGRGRAARAKTARPSSRPPAASISPPASRPLDPPYSPPLYSSPPVDPASDRMQPPYSSSPPAPARPPALSPTAVVATPPSSPLVRAPADPLVSMPLPIVPTSGESIPAEEIERTVALRSSELRAATEVQPDDAEATTAWTGSELARLREHVSSAAVTTWSDEPAVDGATTPPRRPEPAVGGAGPAGTIQLSASELRAQRGETDEPSAPPVSGPERTVALTPNAHGLEREVAQGTVALTPAVPAAQPSTTVLSRHEMFGVSRGGARVVPPADMAAPSDVVSTPSVESAPRPAITPTASHPVAGAPSPVALMPSTPITEPPAMHAMELPKTRVGMWVSIFVLVAMVGVVVGIVLGST